MKKTKILTVLGVLLAMGITACGGGGGKKSSQQGGESSQQGGESSQQGGESSQQGGSQSQGGGSSSQQGGGSSQDHEHSFGEWETKKAATYTELGSQERVCACGEKEQRDVNTIPYNIDATSEIVKLNGDNKKVSQFTYNNGAAKVAAVPMKQISGQYKTEPGATAETWTIGDSSSLTPADTYKLSNSGNGVAILFKVNVAAPIQNALISIGGTFKNDNDRHFYNKGDGGQNGDNPEKDQWRYYTKVNDGEFQHIAFNDYMQNLFEQDDTNPHYMPLGKFNLVAGDNLIYVRQSNLGYRVTLKGYLFVDLGANGEIGGVVPTHNHVAGTAWEKDANQHWHKCVGEECDEPTIKLDAANHEYPNEGAYTPKEAATCEKNGSEERTCSVCGYTDVKVIPALGHEFTSGVAKAYPAGDGYIASESLNCEREGCNKSGLKWSALDYDQTKSAAASDEGKAPKSADNGAAIQLDTSTTQGMGDDHSAKGCHVVYLVNVPEAIEGAGLAMLATQAPYSADIFDQMTNENSRGYYQNAQGEWVVPDSRYGVKVDGTEYLVAKNNGVIKGNGTTWYQFPGISLNLTAGVHEIEIFKYGGYDVSNYAFMLTGFAHVEPAHQHVLGEWQSDEANHWKLCTAAGCLDPEGTKYETAEHTFGEAYDRVEPTCEAAGSYKQKCSVCNYEKTVAIAKLDHQYGDVVATNAAGEGYVATTAYNCALCEKSALRWSAIDFDTTLSSSGIEKNSDNVRFKSGAVENKGGSASQGTHIVYKVNVAEAVEKAGLAFYIQNTGGAGSGEQNVSPVFDTISGDTSLGAIDNGDGTFTTATKRYGLRVNGVEYFLGQDNYGNQNKTKAWFDWPVEFPLQAGVNTIDVFAYAGYRANMYQFQLTGLPKIENTHTHTLGEWQSDANNHWKVCSGEGCPAGEGAHLEEAAHSWNDGVITTEPTHTSTGVKTYTCTVCGATKTEVVAKVAHTYGEAQAKISDATPYECSDCHTMAYQLDLPTPQKLKSDVSWNITGLPAGNYEIELYACASSTTLPQKYDGRYQFKVDDGSYIGASDDNATYASYGLGTGEALDKCAWSTAINQIAVGDSAASFTIHWTNKGYSAFIAAVRLVKVA